MALASVVRPRGPGAWVKRAPPRRGAEHLYDPTAVGLGKARPARQAQPAAEKALGDRPAADAASGEDGLHVHRLPDRAGFDVLGLQGVKDLVPACPEGRWVDRRAGEPAGRAAGRMFGHELDAGQVFERAAIEGEVGPPLPDPPLEHRQLPPGDRGQEVAQPVVVADLRVFVVRGRVAGLGGQEAGPAAQLGVVAGEHPAAAGGDDLVAVEGEAANPPERARRTAAVRRAERFGGVLDDRDRVPPARRQDRLVIRALAIEIDHEHGLRRPAARRQASSSSAKSAGSMFQVARSASMNTGVAPT